MTKEQLGGKIAESVFGCNLPFSVVEKQLFTGMVSALRHGYRPPSRDMVSTLRHGYRPPSRDMVSILRPGYRPPCRDMVSTLRHGYRPPSSDMVSTLCHGYRPPSRDMVSTLRHGYRPPSRDMVITLRPGYSPPSSDMVSTLRHGYRPSSRDMVSTLRHGYRPPSRDMVSTLRHGYRPPSRDMVSTLRHGYRPPSRDMVSTLRHGYRPPFRDMVSTLRHGYRPPSRDMVSTLILGTAHHSDTLSATNSLIKGPPHGTIQSAALKIRAAYFDTRAEDDEPKVIDICVSYDGTWMKRGVSSQYGVGVATDILTGFVIDFELLSLYCHGCAETGQAVLESGYSGRKSMHQTAAKTTLAHQRQWKPRPRSASGCGQLRSTICGTPRCCLTVTAQRSKLCRTYKHMVILCFLSWSVSTMPISVWVLLYAS